MGYDFKQDVLGVNEASDLFILDDRHESQALVYHQVKRNQRVVLLINGLLNWDHEVYDLSLELFC